MARAIRTLIFPALAAAAFMAGVVTTPAARASEAAFFPSDGWQCRAECDERQRACWDSCIEQHPLGPEENDQPRWSCYSYCDQQHWTCLDYCPAF